MHVFVRDCDLRHKRGVGSLSSGLSTRNGGWMTRRMWIDNVVAKPFTVGDLGPAKSGKL
jgi:hypothetical protein